MTSNVEKIKERLQIQDVVSSYIKLEKAGKNLKSKCPFHNEKDASFFVSPDRDTYYCFGCGAKGDIFTFVQEFEGLDFPGALKILAEKAGVEITYESSGNKSEKETLLKILDDATLFYEDKLYNNSEAKKYLKQRGIREETLKEFRIGYAPDSWDALYKYLTKEGYTDSQISKVGLSKKSEKKKGHYDTFRARIMFPILDATGRVIAFSGRVFPPVNDDEAVGERSAKYINSPETPLFQKSSVLYAYDKAKNSMRRNDFVIVVEGQTDVLMSHQAGFKNTVAPLGTSLTHNHLRLVKRLTSNLLLALDADRAGIDSAGRGAELGLSMGFDVKVASLPAGSDPADIIKENPDLWRESVRKSQHIVDFMIENIGGEKEDERDFELEVRKIVLPYVARIENKIDQAHFVKKIAEKLGVGEDSVKVELDKIDSVPYELRQEEDVLSIDTNSRLRRDEVTRRLVGVVVWQDSLDGDSELEVREIKSRLLEIFGVEEFEKVLENYDKDELLFEAEAMFSGSKKLGKYVEEMLCILEEDYLKEKMTDLMKQIKKLESEGKTKDAQSVLEEAQKISKVMGNVQERARLNNE